jgi:preprotein translocase subunit YajC
MTICFAICGLLAMGTPTQPGTQPNPTGQMLQLVGTLAFFVFVMYFLMIRPQQKKAREQADLLKALKPGDKVVTSGGIIGVIVAVKERSVSLRSADTKLEVLKSAVSEITEKSSSES